MSDNIGQKDMILGQPWLYSYSARIEYAHGIGMNLQLWQDGDRDSGQSVRVTLPIMSTPRNVRSIKAIQQDVENEPSTLIDVATLKSTPEFLPEGELNLKKLRPHVDAKGLLIRALESPAIREALYRAYYLRDIVQESKLRLQFAQESIQDGHTFHNVTELTDETTRIVLGDKNKPAHRRIHSIASYNPGCRTLISNLLKLGSLPLLASSMRSENVEHEGLDKLTNESELSSPTYKDLSTELEPPQSSRKIGFVSQLLGLFPWKSKGRRMTEEAPHPKGQDNVSTADVTKSSGNYTLAPENNHGTLDKTGFDAPVDEQTTPASLTLVQRCSSHNPDSDRSRIEPGMVEELDLSVLGSKQLKPDEIASIYNLGQDRRSRNPILHDSEDDRMPECRTFICNTADFHQSRNPSLNESEVVREISHQANDPKYILRSPSEVPTLTTLKSPRLCDGRIPKMNLRRLGLSASNKPRGKNEYLVSPAQTYVDVPTDLVSNIAELATRTTSDIEEVLILYKKSLHLRKQYNNFEKPRLPDQTTRFFPLRNGLADLNKTITRNLEHVKLSIISGDHVKTRESYIATVHLPFNNEPAAITECSTSSVQMEIGKTWINNSAEPMKHMVLDMDHDLTRTEYTRNCAELVSSPRSRDGHVDVEETVIPHRLHINSRNLVKGFNKNRAVNLTKANSPTAEEVGAITLALSVHQDPDAVSLNSSSDNTGDVPVELLNQLPSIESKRHADLLSSPSFHVKTREKNRMRLHLAPIMQQESSETSIVPVGSLKVKRKDGAQVLYKEKSTLNEWKLEMSRTRPEYTPDRTNDSKAGVTRYSCNEYGDFDKPRPYLRCAKSKDPLKHLSEFKEMAIMKMHSSLPDEPENYCTRWSSSKQSGFVGVIPGAPEMVMDIVPHTLCKKKSPDLQVSYKSKLDGLPSGFGCVHDSAGLNFQHMAILTEIFRASMSTTSKRPGAVDARRWRTVDPACGLKSDLLATRNKTILSDNHSLAMKDLPRGLLTWISCYNDASRPSHPMPGSRPCHTHADVEDAMIPDRRWAKSMNLFKDLSRHEEIRMTTTYLPLSGINSTGSSLPGYGESFPSVAAILGEVLEGPRIVLEKEAWHEQDATQIKETKRTCGDGGTSSHRAGFLAMMLSALRPTIFNRSDKVDAQRWHTVDLARVLKNDLLATHDKTFLLDDHILAIKSLVQGALTFVLQHIDGMGLQSATLETDVYNMFQLQILLLWSTTHRDPSQRAIGFICKADEILAAVLRSGSKHETKQTMTTRRFTEPASPRTQTRCHTLISHVTALRTMKLNAF
ncbi:hypothetical protein BS47DRAFT_1401210 [Hydnum rufescens UP504]|uniref:Uncharacterized protein n=1 Tax=Hydnum rufescens UP504 TaxID=1448309 RepID=A0A9P6AFY3_9AGAM|nr:hypothetical protein BS47DRAFT_1401210 [Hydnum rufescens UP504]